MKSDVIVHMKVKKAWTIIELFRKLFMPLLKLWPCTGTMCRHDLQIDYDYEHIIVLIPPSEMDIIIPVLL